MQLLLRILFLNVALPWWGTRLESLQGSVEQQNDVHFPYVVSIQIVSGVEDSYTVDFYAAGALLSETEALSVCHKFLETDQYWQTGGALLVVAGATKLAGNHTAESDTAQMRHVARVIRHPKCQSKIPRIYGYDAAVLILKEPMLLNKHVQPIALKFKDLKQMENKLVEMVKKRVICNSFRWGWMVTETPVTGPITEFLPRMKRDANDTATTIENEEDTNTIVTNTSMTEPGDLDTLTDESGDYVLSLGTASAAIIHSYSEINVNKVLITPNDDCMKAFCMAGQPVCDHDFSSNGQFCTTPWEISNNTCMDYGGPLVCEGHLFGILDFELCFLQRTPSVYAGPKTILQLLAEVSRSAASTVNSTSSGNESACLYPARSVAARNIFLSMILLFIKRNN